MKKNAEMHGRQGAGSLRRKALPVLVAGCFGSAVLANPVGPQVVNGQVNFAQQGNVLSITNSPGSIINWQSFSINPGEVTRFLQQNPNSAVLNRIIGQDPSQIVGALQSNGRVFLINPNGILFGKGAQIDVNGLVASTLNISNQDFLAGKLDFNAGSKAGNLQNQGAITTPAGGQVYLIAPNVENTGLITSPKGDVMLAAGRSVQLVDSANPGLHVVVSAPEDKALNLGQIIAQGGKTGIYGALVNQRGLVSADSAVVGENGKIVFKASRKTVLEVGSQTSASGAGKGGDIQITGERVELQGNARVDASGKAGGGTVLIGGDYLGKNPAIQNAKAAEVDKEAQVSADAVVDGDGGKIIVWSDEKTRAQGKFSARGGAQGGNGGFIETSGHQLNVNGARVDASAPNGKAGSWLLDPDIIRVVKVAGTVTSESQVEASTLEGAGARIDLLASLDVLFDEPTDIDREMNVSAGRDILVNAGITSSSTVHLSAEQNIHLNAGITTTGGEVILTASRSGELAGNAYVDSIIRSNGGNVRIRGTNVAIGHAGGISVDAGNLDLYADGVGGTVRMSDGARLDAKTTSSSPTQVALRTSVGGEIVLEAGSGIKLDGPGAVKLMADTMHLEGIIEAGSTDGLGEVVLQPAGTMRAVEIVSEFPAFSEFAALRLKANDLGGIRAGALTIGSSDFSNGSGDLAINAPLDFSPSKVGTLTLATGCANGDGGTFCGTITQTAPISVGNLAVKAGNDVFLDSATNTVEYLAAKVGNVSSTNKNFRFKNSGPLWIHHVGGISGIEVAMNAPSTAEGNISLITTDGLLTQSEGANLSGRSVYAEGGSVKLDKLNPTGIIAGRALGAADRDNVFEYSSSNEILVTTIGENAGIDTIGLPIRLKSAESVVVEAPVSAGWGEVSLEGKNIRFGGVSGIHINGGAISMRATAVDGKISSTGDAISEIRADTDIDLQADKIDFMTAPPAFYANTLRYATTTADKEIATSKLSPASYHVSNLVIGDDGLHGAARTGNIMLDEGIDLPESHVFLLAGGNINQATTAPVRAYKLGVQAGGTVLLDNSLNSVAYLAGMTDGGDFTFHGGGNLNVSTVSEYMPEPTLNAAASVMPDTRYVLPGIITNGGRVSLKTIEAGDINIDSVIATMTGNVSLTSAGGINLWAPVAAGTGDVTLKAVGGHIVSYFPLTDTSEGSGSSSSSARTGGGLVQGVNLTAEANGGISLMSAVGTLSAINDDVETNSAIHIQNLGPLVLNNIKQLNGNGDVKVENYGGLTLASGSRIETTGGNIKLIAHSPLTINGAIASDTGNIGLEAGASNSGNDNLILNGPVSTAGALDLRAGNAVTVLVQPTAGTVNIAANQNSGGSSPPALPPTVSQCVANPALSGCPSVLPPIDQCVAAPLTAGCSVVLPTVSQCTTAPSTAGCSVVLPTVSQCTTAPSTAGCSVVLPTVSQCTTAPSTAGCSVVLPTVNQCTTAPSTAGCGAVLPTVNQCTTAPATAGCGAVLPTVNQCTAAPSTPGCAAVLPTLAQCSTLPTLSGCSAVLPAVDFCKANPSDPSCQVTPPAPQGAAPRTAASQTIDDTVKTVTLTTTAATEAVSPAGANDNAGGTSSGGKEDRKKDDSKTAAGPEDNGAKSNEAAPKMYCN
jgi:filamentous hemagglutinin family protein